MKTNSFNAETQRPQRKAIATGSLRASASAVYSCSMDGWDLLSDLCVLRASALGVQHELGVELELT